MGYGTDDYAVDFIIVLKFAEFEIGKFAVIKIQFNIFFLVPVIFRDS